MGTSLIPSLATFGNRLYAAWKGVHSDQGIYWSSFDGANWAPQQNIGGVGSSHGPSLAVYGGRLYAAWKGINADSGIYWSSFDGAHWAGQQRIGGVGTSVGPALGVANNQLYAVWKGVTNDNGLWYSSFNGGAWAPQQNIAGVGSSVGPSVAAAGTWLHAAWQGIPGDDGIYWSTLFDETAMSTKLAFTMQPQTQSNWCWAAVSTSISHYFNGSSTWTQCGIANQQLGQTTCCVTPGSAACNQPGYLDRALSTMNILDAWQNGSVPVRTLDGDVVRSLPVGVRIAWSGGGAHFIAVTGAVTSSGLVHVQDPIYGTSDITYNTMSTVYQGTGSWTHTYFTHP